MAKQSFSVGQVLTAAQMTSLQETAMGGGAASSKTANYVLVAADAGTTISMTSTSATTITVNTGLFSAGDTVFIQNLGSATCTITAGTATVNTAGSLILPQYDAGILYFVSASSAIFYDYIQAGAVSPLTTKGDLYTFSTSDARLGVGANGTTLVADSAEATGLKWATPSSGSITLLSTTTLTGTSTTVSGISQDYTNLYFLIVGTTTTSQRLIAVPNSTGDRQLVGTYYNGNPYQSGSAGNLFISAESNSVFSHNILGIIYNYTSTAPKPIQNIGRIDNVGSSNLAGYDYTAAAITSLKIEAANGTATITGTVKIYGVK